MLAQLWIGGHDPLGLAPHGCDKTRIAGHAKQVQAGGAPRLRGPQDIALAAQVEVGLGQGEAVHG